MGLILWLPTGKLICRHKHIFICDIFFIQLFFLCFTVMNLVLLHFSLKFGYKFIVALKKLLLLFSLTGMLFQMEDGKSYQYLPPTQPPISPAYKAAVAMKRSSQQASGEPSTTTTTGKSELPEEEQDSKISDTAEDTDDSLTERELEELEAMYHESLSLDQYGEIR